MLLEPPSVLGDLKHFKVWQIVVDGGVLYVTTWSKSSHKAVHTDKYNFKAKTIRNSSQVTKAFHILAAKYSKLSALEEYSRRYENLHTTQRLIKTMVAI